MASKLCKKCGKLLDETKRFYKKRDGSYTDFCRKCYTMHIDNFNPETFTWLLQDMDVPYIPEEWNVLRDKAFQKNPNLNGMSVFGKYLSKMKLKQWSSCGWADTEKIMAERDQRRQEADEELKEYEKEITEQFENGEISEAQYKTLTSTITQRDNLLQQQQQIISSSVPNAVDNPFNINNFMNESDLIDLGAELTQEDKLAMAMKWGRLYKPAEWVELEKTYTEMTESFDIQDADTINTLILICKTNLKMNQALDCGDIEGYQKLAKVSESLRKTAKFTAAQNKEEKNDYVDSVGELIAICEKDGFIPRFATDIPQDKVDLTLKDMNNYVNKLVTQDLGFGQQIEDALKKIKIQQEMNDDAEMTNDGLEPIELIDQDYEEFYNSVEEQKQIDNEESDS